MNLSTDDHNYSCTKVFDCQDLFTKILLPFPERFLVKLKLVSKQFRYGISHPQFCIDHVRLHHPDRNSLAPTALYFHSSFSNNPETYSVSLLNPARTIPSLAVFEMMGSLEDRQFKIVQSCNGLLLCSNHKKESSDSSSPSSRSYVVCNPTTQAIRTLPELPRIESSSTSKKSKNQENLSPPVLTLAFNPLQTHVYKVFSVRMVNVRSQRSTFELLVYSSDEGGRAWRNCDCEFSIPVGHNPIHHGVFHDGGNITWICEGGFIYFDVQAERLIKVKIRSSKFNTWKNIRFFGEGIDGSLLLISRRENIGIDVNQLRPETSEWKRLANHHPRRFLWNRYSIGSADMYQILGVKDEGKTLILAIPGRVIEYYSLLRSYSVLTELPEQESPELFSFGCVNSFQFVETLSPV